MKRVLVVLTLAACHASPERGDGRVAEGDHIILAGDVTLAYHVHGRGPVCLVHPGGPGLDWSYLRMPDVERTLTLVYLEPIGTGASTAPPDPKAYTFNRYAQTFEQFRAALGLDKPCVLGHSYGGMVALHWAVAHPDHVGALILYDTAARNGPDTIDAQQFQTFSNDNPWFAKAVSAIDRESKVMTDDEATALFHDEAPMLFATWPEHPEYAQLIARTKAYAMPFRGGNANQGPWDLRDKLAVIKAPTLVLEGDRDWITPAARAQELVSGIAGAKLVTLPNAGHMGHIEATAPFVAAIEAFVPSLGPSLRAK